MSVNNSRLKSNSELKTLAREQLKGKWGIAILVCFISWILTQTLASNSATGQISVFIRNSGQGVQHWNNPMNGIGGLIQFIIGGAVTFGVVKFFLGFVRGAELRIETMFDGFKLFIPTFLLNLLVGIFTFLWSLLFIIPGIIAALRYSMSFYILNDNPEMGVMDVINTSKEMMKGHKGRLFMLYLSFIGWAILCLFTLGIGFLWLNPYIKTTIANFYEDLKNYFQQDLQ